MTRFSWPAETAARGSLQTGRGRAAVSWAALGPRVALVLSIALLVPAVAAAHGGGLNAEGCHYNRKTGDYHCHRDSGAAPPSTAKPPAQPLVPQVPQTRRDTSGTGSKGSAAERLQELKRLRDQGLITPQQYERKQTEILDDF